MAWWKPWRREAKATDVSDLVWSALYGAQSSSGVSVTVDRALQVSVVLACARVIAEGIAQMPCKLYRETEAGGKEPARDHPVYRLLHRRPNAWMTGFEFRELLSFHAVLTGAGYAYVNRVRGEVRELLPILPGNVVPEQDANYNLTFKVTDKQGVIATLSRDQVLYLRGPSWESYRALDIVRQARESIGLAIATETSQSKLFANGAKPGGILSTDQVLTETQIERIKAAFVAATSGDNQFKSPLLDAGIKYSQIGMTGVDSQQLESRHFQIEEICRAMRVFPQMVMSSDKTSTYASAEQFFLAHVVHSLGPWVERWEQVIDRDLLTDAESESGLFAKLTVAGLLRGDAKTRAEYYRTMSALAAMNPNEIRSLEDMNPYEGGGVYSRQINIAPVGPDGRSIVPEPAMAPAPTEDTADAAV